MEGEAKSAEGNPAPVTGEKRPEHLVSLTAVRFVAALLVLLGHHQEPLLPALPPVFDRFVQRGFVGVNLFFLLSGFILAYNYLDRFKEKRVTPKKFWVARFARIYPVYALSLLLMLPRFFMEAPVKDTTIWAHENFPIVVLTHLFLVQNWTVATSTVWNHPTWSIGVEAGFYLLFPLLVIPVARLASRWIWLTFFVLFALSWIMPALYHTRWLIDHPVPGFSRELQVLFRDMHYVTREWTIFRVPEFVMGMLLARAYMERVYPARWLGTIAGAGLVAVVLLLTLPMNLDDTFVFLGQVWLTLPFAALILFLAVDRGRVSKALSWAPLVLLGEASYSLYVLHIWVKHTVSYGTSRFLGFGEDNIAFALISIPLAVVVSVIAYRRVETPARRWLVSRFGGRNYGTA